jgi:hypothetical protein
VYSFIFGKVVKNRWRQSAKVVDSAEFLLSYDRSQNCVISFPELVITKTQNCVVKIAFVSKFNSNLLSQVIAIDIFCQFSHLQFLFGEKH